MCSHQLLLSISSIYKETDPNIGIAMFNCLCSMFDQLCERDYLYNLSEPIECLNLLVARIFFEGNGVGVVPYISVSRAAKQRTGAGLDLLSNLPSTTPPSFPPTPKMTNVSWQSDGFSSLSCGLPCNLAPPYPKGSSSQAIVSLDGAKVKVERRRRFPSGILQPAL